MFNYIFNIILWHAGPLLGGNLAIGVCTSVVARQRPANNNRGMVFIVLSAKQQYKSNIGAVFSLRSESKCNKQEKSRV
jgi:hypothetical protein